MNCEKEKFIDGKLFEKMVISGVKNLKANIETVNDLNVFPIPDGDTGDNMFMTINGGLAALESVKENSVSKKANALANAMLLNARGNSGVILSQLFSGLAKGFKDKERVCVKELGLAFASGVKQAYASVVKPVEGTMLTVAREASDYGLSHSDETVTLGTFFNGFIEEMKASLENTPNLLEVLKEAGVIDSGGAGLLYISEGMKIAVEGKEVNADLGQSVSSQQAIDFSAFNENSEMKFGYCTEFLLQLLNSKVDANAFDVSVITDYLGTIGDSIVAFKTGTVVKVHVHTLTPYKALEFCHQYGEFLTVKMENMTVQHNETVKKEVEPVIVKQRKGKRTPFGVVTVATGKGLVKTFADFGADVVIDGGQGNNPSTETFIKAFDDANADCIFVLPNNSNIIMTAKQAANAYDKSKIYVIETKNFGHAYSVLSMLDYSAEDADEIAESMCECMQGVTTGMITTSVRDAFIDGVQITKDHYIGFTDKTMYVCEQNKVDTFFALADKLDIAEKEFLITVFGKDVNEQDRESVRNKVAEKYSNVEFYEIDGGQDVYDFILIIE